MRASLPLSILLSPLHPPTPPSSLLPFHPSSPPPSLPPTTYHHRAVTVLATHPMRPAEYLAVGSHVDSPATW